MARRRHVPSPSPLPFDPPSLAEWLLPAPTNPPSAPATLVRAAQDKFSSHFMFWSPGGDEQVCVNFRRTNKSTFVGFLGNKGFCEPCPHS